jgi:acyl carrier protein
MQADVVAPGMLERIAALVRDTGRIEEIGVDEDFYDAGFTSLRSLELLLQLETEWAVSIPDEEFVAARTVRSLGEMLARVKETAPCD